MEEKIIIGRETEKNLLKEIYESTEAELVAVYGRRRVVF
jgi:AAA+ ATPase superfamily predicted ATPase